MAGHNASMELRTLNKTMTHHMGNTGGMTQSRVIKKKPKFKNNASHER
jgi:hypothetical protein